MAFNLVDILKDQVAGQLASKAGSMLGESEGGISKALTGIFPTLLGTVLGKVKSDDNGASNLMGMLKDFDGGMLDNIGGALSGDGASNLMNQGGGILDSLLGDKVGGIVSMISKFSGLGSGSSKSLISMAAPMLMSVLGSKVRSEGLGISGLKDMIMGQEDNIKSAMPSGLSSMPGFDIGNLLDGKLGALGGLVTGAVGLAGKGLGAVGDAGKGAVEGAASLGKDAVNTVGNVANAGIDGGKKVLSGAGDLAGKGVDAAGDLGKGAVKAGGSLISTILKWALPILAIIVAAYFIKGCMDGKSLTDAATGAVGATTDLVTDGASGAADMAGDAADMAGDAAGAVAGAVSGAFGKVNDAAKATLDKITFAAGSAGDQFVSFIEGGFEGDSRFRFNNLNFATGSAQITGESGVEVDNVAAILAAYPDVTIKVEGYTDNTGNAANNKTLSQARAESVKAKLIGAGIDASRIEAEGFGDANPVGDNSTEEGRASNRRIEIVVTNS